MRIINGALRAYLTDNSSVCIQWTVGWRLYHADSAADKSIASRTLQLEHFLRHANTAQEAERQYDEFVILFGSPLNEKMS